MGFLYQRLPNLYEAVLTWECLGLLVGRPLCAVCRNTPLLLPTRAPGNAQIVGGWFKHLLREQHNSTHCYLAWTPSPTTATCKLPTLKWRPALTVCSICLNMLINLWQRCTIDAKSSGTNMVNVFRAVLIHNMLNKMFSFLSWWSSSSNKRRRQYD